MRIIPKLCKPRLTAQQIQIHERAKAKYIIARNIAIRDLAAQEAAFALDKLVKSRRIK